MQAPRGAGSLPKSLLRSEALGSPQKGFMPSSGHVDPCHRAPPGDTERQGLSCPGREGLEGVCEPEVWVHESRQGRPKGWGVGSHEKSM